MLAVYIDEGVDEIEYQSIVTAAKQLQGVTVERAPTLENRLSRVLSERVHAAEAANNPQADRAVGYPFISCCRSLTAT